MAQVEWSTNWQPPALSAMNFNPRNKTVCQAAGAWQASSANALQDNRTTITVDVVLAYIKAVLPPRMAKPDDLTLLMWYNDYILTDVGIEGFAVPGSVTEKLVVFPLESCSADVCKNLDWVGDADVSGRGMLITYYIAAGLVTTYLGALALFKLGSFRRRYPEPPKVLSGFEASVNAFIDSALVFAVSMVGAACFRLAQAFLQDTGVEDGHWMIYASIGSIYMSTFSIFLPLLLQNIAHGLRQHWLRLVLWTLITLFSIANAALFNSFFARVRGDKPSDSLEIIWLDYCNPATLSYEGLLPTLVLAQISLFLNAVYYVVYTSCKGRGGDVKRWSRIKAFLHKADRYIRIFNIVYSWLLMWAMLGLFHAYRDAANEASGDDNQNSSWTFGQVLSVATWIPILLEFLTVLWHGPEKGLSRKLPKKFTVVPTTEPVNHDKKEAQYLRVEDEHPNY
ncbi:hypothetical protein F4677DRAFT_448296 [Hypoxylon crocopeplum]|nr:hypothetical protein F4677DRAFT_448296 [Hypoxylon crocopeplum]